jgi:hypothetical protein
MPLMNLTAPVDPLTQAEAELIVLQQDIQEREDRMRTKQASTGKSSVPVQTLRAIQTRKGKEASLKTQIERLRAEKAASEFFFFSFCSLLCIFSDK